MDFKLFQFDGQEVIINLDKVTSIRKEHINSDILHFRTDDGHTIKVDSVDLDGMKKLLGIKVTDQKKRHSDLSDLSGMLP